MLYFRGNRLGISTHAPRTGSDGFYLVRRLLRVHEFQPTLPARGATIGAGLWGQTPEDFNPRSPHGERLAFQVQEGNTFGFQPTLPARGATYVCRKPERLCPHFNPRSPHGERLNAEQVYYFDLFNFNPRSPHGERQAWGTVHQDNTTISTHAPRTGSDAEYRG